MMIANNDMEILTLFNKRRERKTDREKVEIFAFIKRKIPNLVFYAQPKYGPTLNDN